MLKDYCVACLDGILNSEKHFNTFGNYCLTCSKRSQLLAQTKSQIRDLKSTIERIRRLPITEDRIEYLRKKAIYLRASEVELANLIESAPQYLKSNLFELPETTPRIVEKPL